MLRHHRLLLSLILSAGLFSAAVAWQGKTPTTATRSDKAGEVLPVLRDGPRWWKGNLHTHSFWSDGDDFPEMIADWYRNHGYHFLSLSDHDILSEGERWLEVPAKGVRVTALEKYRARFGKVWVEERTVKEKHQVRLKPLAEFRSLLEEPGKFLLIPAEEVSASFSKKPVHFGAINLRDVIKPVSGDGVAETIRVNHRLVAEQRKRTGGKLLTILNHPNFRWGVKAEDMAGVEELRYFEVYNGHPSVRNEGDATHADTERLWDIVLALRLGKHRLGVLYGLATDDAHGYHTFGVGKVNPGRGWVMVRAPYLSAESVVRALEAGDFYSSTGVGLREVVRKGEQISLVVQSEPGVRYRTQFLATLRDVPLTSEERRDKEGKPLDVTRVYHPDVGKVVAEVEGPEASYRMMGTELYVRARVTSSKPHPNPYKKNDVETAWTQPVLP